MLKFIESGQTSGDCTTPYKVILNAPCQLRHFINHILEKRSGEWGSIYICNPDKTITELPRLEYRYGRLKEIHSLDLINLNAWINNVNARGGYTCMDYYVTLEGFVE